MPEASASVIINHPAATVWEWCQDPDNVAAYLPGTLSISSDGKPMAVGSQWSGKTRVLGKTMDWTGEFTRVDAGKGTEFTTTRSAFAMTSWTELEETGEGTQFSFRMVTEAGLGGLFGRLADAVVTRSYQHALTGGVEAIPDLVDAWVADRA
ncbi:SRPBCC family protein [Gordonia sp. CPCC 205515]|uniref:SRPBCC family protein n=1 Tax=Gordonia sp. CPCC 205515 TaxID=3140791 RepID=UPI003AF376A5